MNDISINFASSQPRVDLRSDTVTRPTESMYERMRAAPLGDDALDGDPTTRMLEGEVAELLGTEAALFTPSCTMANLLATLVHAPRGDQVILQAQSHMYNAERGGALLTGAFHVPVAGPAGTMDIELLVETLSTRASHLRTAMVALETSHNSAGGTVLPLDYMAQIRSITRTRGVALHVDGARLFNAAVSLNLPAAEIARHADSVAICLSKGLSAPVGAVLAGRRNFIEKARNYRRMLGGQQRQVGIAAAAGIEALALRTRLHEDHARARRLASLLAVLSPVLDVITPQTNIVMVDVSRSGCPAQQWVDALDHAGVQVRPWAGGRLRCVLHRHIDDSDIERTANVFAAIVATLKCPGEEGAAS